PVVAGRHAAAAGARALVVAAVVGVAVGAVVAELAHAAPGEPVGEAVAAPPLHAGPGDADLRPRAVRSARDAVRRGHRRGELDAASVGRARRDLADAPAVELLTIEAEALLGGLADLALRAGVASGRVLLLELILDDHRAAARGQGEEENE